MRQFVVAASFLAVIGCKSPKHNSGASTDPADKAQQCKDCRVVTMHHCYDGDTCTFNEFETRVRFARIDTAEMDGDCRADAVAAKKAVVAKLRDADTICVTKTGVGRDGRIIGEVCADGENVNNWLMREGYAVDYGRDTCGKSVKRIGPPPQPNGECGEDVDCSELESCEEAKAYLDACPGDPHRLDRDGDGTPCESLCE